MKYLLLVAALSASTSARACDLCACELPALRLDSRPGWHAGAASQFTEYGRLQDSGHRISNSADQFLHSSITQIYAGYGLSDSLSVQFTLPYIYRSFRRAEGGGIENGKVSGLGDLSLVGSWRALDIERGDFHVTARVNAGIKLPTGESDRLAEEGHEEQEHSDAPASGVHGHDLALGTGSLDGVFGSDVFCQWKRAFFEAGFQYTLRGDGGHSYDFADDLSWNVGAGYVVVENTTWNATLGVRFSGESKGEDHFRGERLDDTSITTVFVGPTAAITWKDGMSANVALGIPIRRDNSGIQTVPEYRVQAGVSWMF